jgi:hypothetical protein
MSCIDAKGACRAPFEPNERSEIPRGSQVNVVGHLERSPDQMHVWRRFHQHLHNIESIWHPRVIQQSEPFLCATDDPVLLGSRHSCVRRAECVGRACFHFDENQCFFTSIAANQVDFTAPSRSEISVENTKSIKAKVIGGHFFALASKRQMGWGDSPANRSWPESNEKENTSEQPVRMSVDESDRVRGSVSFQGAPAFHSLCFG